jgi:hypothetical protein
MRVRGILTLALTAMVFTAVIPFVSLAASYSDMMAAVDNSFVTYIGYAGQTTTAGMSETISWSHRFCNWDQYADAGLNPRLNWDSSSATEGSDTSSTVLHYQEEAYLHGSPSVDGYGTSVPLHISCTFHQTYYPYSNSVAQANNYFTVV